MIERITAPEYAGLVDISTVGLFKRIKALTVEELNNPPEEKFPGVRRITPADRHNNIPAFLYVEREKITKVKKKMPLPK